MVDGTRFDGTRFDIWVIKTAQITSERYPNVESGERDHCNPSCCAWSEASTSHQLGYFSQILPTPLTLTRRMTERGVAQDDGGWGAMRRMVREDVNRESCGIFLLPFPVPSGGALQFRHS